MAKMLFNPAVSPEAAKAVAGQTATAREQALAARVAELEAKLTAKLSVRINDVKDGKDAPTISVLGLRRFPVSFYPGEWDTLLSPDIVNAVRAAQREIARKK